MKQEILRFPKHRQNLYMKGNHVYSYDTRVATIDLFKRTIRARKFYSRTTSRHINYVAQFYALEVIK